MPAPCAHSPSVAGSCVACTVQQGMAALVWRAAAVAELAVLRVELDRAVRCAAVIDPAAVAAWLETITDLLQQAAELEGTDA